METQAEVRDAITYLQQQKPSAWGHALAGVWYWSVLLVAPQVMFSDFWAGAATTVLVATAGWGVSVAERARAFAQTETILRSILASRHPG